MAIAIRGGSPGTNFGVTATISLVLNGTRQPQAGDVIICVHGNDFFTLANMPTPTFNGSTTGVTAITGTGLPADGGSSFAHVKAYSFVVGSTGDVTISVTETGLADEEKCLVGYVLSGVDTTTPVDIAAGNFDSSGTTNLHVCPTVTTTPTNDFLICHVNDGNGGNSGAVTSFPSGMTSAYDVSAGGMRFSGATQQLSASGATGTKTFTKTGSASYGSATIAVKTAAGGGGAVITPGPIVVPPAAMIRASTW